MLSKWLTEILVLLAVGLGVACVCIWLHEHGICPLKAIKKVMRKMSFIGICVLALWAVPLIQYGSTKGGGTNNVQNVANVEMLPMANSNIQLGNGNIGTGNNFTMATLITSTNTTRTITGDDFRRGFVLSRVGTDEAFDFSAPTGATVCSDWRAFGAATDWIYESVKWKVESVKWRMGSGEQETDGETMLRIYSDGWAEVKDGPVFYPFKAVLGIVPEANWQQILHFTLYTLHSQFWHYVTPSNTLQITWQNALLDRDTDTPLSFQIEFRADGQFTCRYDLSRCGALGDRALPDGIITNAVAGASFAGNDWTTNAIPTNVTSMTFYPLSAEDAVNPDPDNDGLATIDELFVYHTDPRHPDSDYDGLTDYEELFVYNSDPLDPNSISTTYCDGFAAKLGDLDPFACPEGSTNTIYEHIFYTGTTNAPFAYPVDTNDTAVLTITVSGSGAGRIVIGDIVVPVMARPASPPLRGSGGDGTDPTANSVHIPLPRGVELSIWGSIPETLQAEIDSESYTIGRLPAWYTLERGWIAFPNTKAKEPCIHDLNAKKLLVHLDPGSDIKGLVCTWNATDTISVEAKSDLSAELTGSFPRSSTTPVTYTLTHPNYLCGATQYTQTARFCPRLSEGDDNNQQEDDNGLPKDGMPVDGEYGDEHSCSCGYGACCGNPWCDCGCACCETGDDETPANVCVEHNCPYDQCESLHLDAYTNAMAVASMLNVLKLGRDPVYTNTVPIDVPDTWVKCCDCPEHWTNYVALAAKSYNLAVRTADGERFERTVHDCNINVHGLAPSKNFEDSVLALCKTGVVYETHRYTVLGLKIDHPYFDIKKLNDRNAEFGFPVVIGTNRIYGADFRLRTDVDLPAGNIHIGLAGGRPGFKLYLGSPLYGLSIDGTVTDEPLLLADSSTGKSFDVSLKQWKKIVAQHTSGREITVTLTAAQEGATDIVFGFAATNGNKCASDVVRQRVTAIKPPLLADYNHNGRIDAEDLELFRLGNPFRFWVNEEKIKLDRVPVPLPVVGGVAEWLSPEPLNTSDFVVNGTYDLLNLFAVAIDLHDLTNKWDNCTVSYRIGGDSWGSSLNVTLADIPWGKLKLAQTNDVQTVYGGQLRSAPLAPLMSGDVVLDDVIQSFGPDSGVMLAESRWWDSDAIALKVYLDGAEAFRCRLPIRTRPVRWMYRWINSRRLSGEGEARPTDISLPDNAPYGVDGMKKLIFLHGANVREPDAELWGDQLFKRLWHTGCNVDFYNVDWRSDIGSDANYHQNASNAFEVAAQLVTTITNIPGEKVMMAHSLGNMVVSSMIQDHGLTNNIQYIACNSAVPVEAYDTRISIRVPQLVHPDWDGYPTNSWTSIWHTLFAGAADDRKHLGWPGRFSNVLGYLVADFYSLGDEVLELAADNDVGILTGVTNSLSHHSWHKQEMFKGRGIGVGAGATDWSGWNIDENWFGVNKISVEEALRMTDTDFRTNTVFHCYPTSMNSPTIPLLVRGAHLALGIPALAPATGAQRFGSAALNDIMIDVNANTPSGVERVNGWPSMGSYTDRWCHSDMKDVSYFFNFKFYEKVVEKGELK